MKHLIKILEETNRAYNDELHREDDEVVIMDLFEEAIAIMYKNEHGEAPNVKNPTMEYSKLLGDIEDMDVYTILDVLDDTDIKNDVYYQDVLSAYIDEIVTSENFKKSLVKGFKHYASELQRGIVYDLEKIEMAGKQY